LKGRRGFLGKKEFTKELSPDGEDRLRAKINVEKGVVVQYESRIKEKWYCIVRYDCSHGFFHRDMLNVKGEEIKQSISINNLKDALTYAEQDVRDRWEWYKERFKKGIK
jgi:hypothetical protein